MRGIGQGDEAVMEDHRHFVRGVHHQGVGRDLGAGGAIQGVGKKRSAKTLPLEFQIHGLFLRAMGSIPY